LAWGREMKIVGAQHAAPPLPFFFPQTARGVAILSARAARARAKHLLADDCGTKGGRGTRASEGPACGRPAHIAQPARLALSAPIQCSRASPFHCAAPAPRPDLPP